MKGSARAKRLLAAAILAATMLAVAAPAAAGPAVPFRARFAGVGAATLAYPYLHVEFVGGGQATQLGRFATVQRHTIDLRAPQAPVQGTYAFTAADGDTLHGGYTFTQRPLPNGDLAITGRFGIDGGTGRFAGATGGGTASGTVFAAGGGAVALDGTISTVGSR